MRRFVVVLILLLAVWLAFAQVGVCPCWLEKDIAAGHPHFVPNQDKEHGHEYLLDFSDATVVIAALPLVLQASLFIASLIHTGVLRGFANLIVLNQMWQAVPRTPPPRLSPAF